MKGCMRRTAYLKFLALLVSISIIVSTFGSGIVNAANDDLNPSTIDLYFVNSIYDSVLSVPSGYPTSYKINVSGLTGTPTYEVVTENDCADVSSDGVITPQGERMVFDGVLHTFYNEGKETIRVTCGDYKKDITVNVRNYAKIVVDNKLSEILGSIIKDNMSEFDKLYAMTKWVADNTDYDTGNSDYISMILFERGNCVGSADIIVQMCTKLGIKAKIRNGNQDIGAGENHHNAIAVCDGKFYKAEAGAGGTKPRFFSVDELYSGFAAYDAAVYQYDGYDSDVVVPEVIEGVAITGFGNGKAPVFYPDFLTQEIKSVKLPKTVCWIGGGAFAKTPKIKIIIDSDNNYLTMSDGNIYSKDMTKLVYVAPSDKAFSIGKDVTVIAAQALSYVEQKSIVIPSNVKVLDGEAFKNSGFKQIEIEEGLDKIGANAFDGSKSLSTLSIPVSVTEIGADAFADCNKLQIYYAGSKEDWNKIKIGSQLPDYVKLHFQSVRVTGIDLGSDKDIVLTDTINTLELKAKVIPSSASCQSIVYTSDDESVVKVDGNKIIAVSEGTCKVTATSVDGGFSESYNVTVRYNIYKLTLDGALVVGIIDEYGNVKQVNKTEHEYKVGERVVLGCRYSEYNDGLKFVKWSLDNDIELLQGYSVTDDFIAIKLPGRNVTVKAEYDKVLAQSIHITFPYESMRHMVCVGNKIQLTAETYPRAYNEKVKWSSNNPKIASIDQNGILTAVAEGEAEITATAEDGGGASSSIYVYVSNHSWNEGTVSKEPTCCEEGEKVFACTNDGCTATRTEKIPKKDHKLTYVEEKLPTKNTPGNIGYYVCSECGKYFSDDQGKNELTKEQTILPATGHVLTKVEAKEATCTDDGNIEYYICNDPDCGCNMVFKDKEGKTVIKLEDTVIPAHHKLTEVPGKDATCKEDGCEKYYKCSGCGKLFSDPDGKNEIPEPVVLPKLGHDMSNLEHHAAKDPTYMKDGNIEYWKCTRCGHCFTDKDCAYEIEYEKTIIPKKGAAVLGETAEAGDFSFRVTNPATDGSGTVSLTGVAEQTQSVSIPATVEIKEVTYKVTRIESNTFNGNKTIRTLYIGANIAVIDGKAFYGCSNLTKVYGGAGLKTIGSYAFAKCPKLSSFKLSSYVLAKIGTYAFSGDKKLKTLYIKYTTKLTKSGVKKSLKGSKVKTVKVKKSKVKKYKKYFTKKNCGRKVKVKK